MTISQFIEESMLRRLSDRSKDVQMVSPQEFSHIMASMDDMLDKLAARTKVPGVTSEDLKSLYGMKVHQTLRRGNYDRTRNPRTFFYQVLSNMNRDMNRLVGVAERQQLDADGFEHSFLVDTTVDEIYAPEQERHPLDQAMEKLNEQDRKIIEITLSHLDKGNPVLVPLARTILEFWI